MENLSNFMFRAVTNKDMGNFMYALQNGLPRHHIFVDGPPSFRQTSLIEHVCACGFEEGLKVLLHGPYLDKRKALKNSCRSQTDGIVRILLEDSCHKQRDCCEYLFVLLKDRFFTWAKRFIRMNNFMLNDNTFCIPGRYVNSSLGRPGVSPLHVSAALNCPMILEDLLQLGALVEARDGEGYRPLFFACYNGNVMTTKILLQHGASPSYNDAHLYNPNSPRSALFAVGFMSNKSEQVNDSVTKLLQDAGMILNKEKIWITLNQKARRISQVKFQFILANLSNTTPVRLTSADTVRCHLMQLSAGMSIKHRVQSLRGVLPASLIETYFLV